MSSYYDGEVLGLDRDGRIIQWDKPGHCRYNCGETPEQFGIENLTAREKKRLGIRRPK